MTMVELFQAQRGKITIPPGERVIAISSCDDKTYIATLNNIYSTVQKSASENTLTLEKIYTSGGIRIRTISTLPLLKIIIIVLDDRILIRHLDAINDDHNNHSQAVYIQADEVKLWSSVNSSHMVNADLFSDSMSLATAVMGSKTRNKVDTSHSHPIIVDTNTESNDTSDNNDGTPQAEETCERSENEESLISYAALISKSQIVILKWLDSQYVDRYNLYLTNVKFVEFMTEEELICMTETKPNDLVHVNLKTYKVKHHDMTRFLHLKNSMLSLRTRTQLSNLSFFNNQLVFLKYVSFLNLSFPTFNVLNISQVNNPKFRNSLAVFPFIFLFYDTNIEVRSISDFKLFQTLSISSLLYDFSDTKLSVLSKDKIVQYTPLRYNDILDQLYKDNDFDNAILLVENLNISEFIDDDEAAEQGFNPKQTKFVKLRKFKLLKAANIIHEDDDIDIPALKLTQAFDLFIEYMASPKLVISLLPTNMKLLLDDTDKVDSGVITSVESSGINEFIQYLTDTRRKLIRFQDNDSLVFQYNNLEISLSIYEKDEPDFSVLENLRLLDTYLFKCYLLVNRKMINPFLRVENYCDFSLVEQACKHLGLYNQLANFYYARKEFAKSIGLLVESRDRYELLKYLQKMVQVELPPVELIIENIKNSTDNAFEKVFLNDQLDYTNVQYKQVLSLLEKNNLAEKKMAYLEFIVFHENVRNSEIINNLFDTYFTNIDENNDRIEMLFQIGVYNANTILKKIKGFPVTPQTKRLSIPPLFKLGRYDDILNIYVYDLNDIESAIEFCLNIRNIKNDSLSKGLVFKVLDLCLKIKDYTSIIRFILNNPELDFLNFEEILIKLPSEISMNLMSSYLIMNLRKLNSINHNIIIKNELLKVNVIDMKMQKMNLEKKAVKLNQNSVCARCGKTFSKSEIICFHPSGTILHYSCSKE